MTTNTAAAENPTDADQLSEVIRNATWDAHQAAEHASFVQDLLGGRLPVEAYARFAAQQHAIYAVLEEAVEQNTFEVIAPFLAPELTRLPALTADLEFLAGADWADKLPVLASTEAYCRRLRDVCFDSPTGLLAHHYVRYLGDLSGGQVIGRVLQRIYGFDDTRGTSFYRFPAIASPKQFKARYRELLDALPWQGEERQRLLDEATIAFELNTAVFEELGPLPVLASQGHDRHDANPEIAS